MESELKAEPVAWRARHSETENWHMFDYLPSWWEVEPLYANPAPSPALQVDWPKEEMSPGVFVDVDPESIHTPTPAGPVEELDAIREEFRTDSGFYDLSAMLRTIAALRAQQPAPQVKALIEALEWYGEQSRLCRLIHSEGDAGRHALASDGGKRAHAALSALSGEAQR